MKRGCRYFFLIVILLLCGCNRDNKQNKDLLPADTATFAYEETGVADALTVDEDGLLYISRGSR